MRLAHLGRAGYRGPVQSVRRETMMAPRFPRGSLESSRQPKDPMAVLGIPRGHRHANGDRKHYGGCTPDRARGAAIRRCWRRDPLSDLVCRRARGAGRSCSTFCSTAPSRRVGSTACGSKACGCMWERCKHRRLASRDPRQRGVIDWLDSQSARKLGPAGAATPALVSDARPVCSLSLKRGRVGEGDRSTRAQRLWCVRGPLPNPPAGGGGSRSGWASVPIHQR
jgi:hypothetical protein